MCLWTTCAPCASHFAHPAHNISLLQRMLLCAECLSLQAYASCAHLHPHKRLRNVLLLTCIRIRGSEMFSPAPQSLSLGRWRVTELGDDECQSWEMTSVRDGRWRKGRGGDDECDKAEMTSARKWWIRASVSGDDERDEEEMTSVRQEWTRSSVNGDDERESCEMM